jgi:hypothetical protein
VQAWRDAADARSSMGQQPAPVGAHGRRGADSRPVTHPPRRAAGTISRRHEAEPTARQRQWPVRRPSEVAIAGRLLVDNLQP